MKKTLLLIAAAVAAITLCSATIIDAGTILSGTVTVESSAVPALTFSVQGCKVHAEGLSWAELDSLFLGTEIN